MEKLSSMKLRGMSLAFNEQASNPAIKNLSFEERFGLIVDAEWIKRKNNHLTRLLKKATLKLSGACIEDIEYHGDRKLNKETITELSVCNYVRDKRNVIVMGASGAGKTFIGCALGNAACRNLMSTKYIRLPELLTDMEIARGDGSYKRVLNQYRKYELLIFDEWLLSPLSIVQARDLLEIIEARHQCSSSIFISQFAAAGWHLNIGEGTIADAVLDRIVHNSYEILIEGQISMRERKSFKK
jgi:DNA replication protein DnaC